MLFEFVLSSIGEVFRVDLTGEDVQISEKSKKRFDVAEIIFYILQNVKYI